MSPSRASSPQAANHRLAAIESLDDIVIGVDAELRVTTWNAAAARVHDRTAADVIGTPLLLIVAAEFRLDEGRFLARALAGDPIPRHDTLFVRRDGTNIPVSVAIAPVGDGSGKVSELILLGRDVTAQQRLQTQLLQAKRMESTGHLAGGIAYEFNNILTAILALAEFTAKELPAGGAPQSDLEEIRQQATKGVRLVKHLLAFSRRQVLRTEVVHLGAIFQELEPLLQRLVSERVLLAIDAAHDARAVEIDRAQLELVLIELVSNASDAMETGGGGTLTVGSRPMTVAHGDVGAGAKPGDYVQFTVQDTGIGFDPSLHARLIEPFYTTKGEGHTGLGLSMVDGVISQHGGSLSFTSSPGQGTTVKILLPASALLVTGRDPAPMPAGEDRGNETILVVEDEAAVRNIICRSLRGRGYHVLEAKNGEDALLVAEKHNAPIHLVITDVVMPEMGGTELFHHLRRWYPTMRILFISGYAKGSIPEEALEPGAASGFLPKPFTLAQLAAEVHRIIALPRPQVAVRG
jgi:two-component system, cell cycle sensor histidine kinase and response regulator CckA